MGLQGVLWFWRQLRIRKSAEMARREDMVRLLMLVADESLECISETRAED